MRPGVILAAVASIMAISLGISATGRYLAGDSATPTAAAVPAEPKPADPVPEKNGRVRQPHSGVAAKPAAPVAPGQTATDAAKTKSTDVAGYERVEPRAPLSDLGKAKSPPPKTSQDWDGTNLFRPVANAAGVFEAMGYVVTVAGMDIVGPEETCVHQGETWPCGALARTAFRSFLRGRAVTCALPPEGAEKNVAVDCRIGDQNVGEWLVSNGWARAAENGPYGDAGERARSAAKGIFGPPPRSLE